MKIFIYLIIAFLFFSCSKKKEIKSVSFELSQNFEIETEKDIINSNNTSVFYYDWDSLELIGAYSQINNTIYLFDYYTKEIYKRINLNHLGIDRIRTFQFDGSDLIIVVEELTTNYFVLNGKGELLNSFNFDFLDPKLNSGRFSSNNGGAKGNSMKFFNGKLVINIFPMTSDPEALNHSYELILNNYKGENPLMKNNCTIVDSFNLYRSQFFDVNKFKGVWNTFTCVNGDYLFFSFAESNDILLYNNGKFKELNLEKSKYVDEEYFDFSNVANSLYFADYMVRNNWYSSLIYDRYRNLYYRMVLHGNQDFELERTHFQWSGVKPFSIMIFDEDFNFINEQIFPPFIYYTYTPIIPTKEGVLISKYNSFNPELKSYMLQFDLFNVNVQYSTDFTSTK